jgi:HlyD family secretion protein
VKKVFRQVALDRLSSPEQLDQLLQVTSSRAWLALGTLLVLTLGGLVWGFLGRLPEQVAGRGILLRSGGVLEIVPAQGGRVRDLAVEVGQLVQAGQVIARVYQPEQADRLLKARAARDLQRAEYERTVRYNGETERIQVASLTQNIANLRQSIASAEQEARYASDKADNQAALVQRGLLTRQTLMATREQLESLKERIRSYSGQIAQTEAELIRVRADAHRGIDAARVKLLDAERELGTGGRDLREMSEVTTPYTGRILEVLVGEGDVVRAGEAIASLDRSGRAVQGLEAVVYVRSADGKRLRPGMSIFIAPSTAKSEEYGFMVGRVTYVSSFPATARGMARLLKNDKLVASLSGNDAPYQVHADLTPDPQTVSRYRWTSSSGPPIAIESGTLCSANILVDERRPVELVVPYVRKATGI